MPTDTTKKPWHDTPPCPSCAGPLVPGGGYGSPEHVLHIRCAACGDFATLDPANDADLLTIARVWWSAGAWRGHSLTEENRK